MTYYEVKRMIDAPIEAVWDILVDEELLGSGGFGIVRIQGKIRLRGKIKVWSEVDPKRAFPLEVKVMDAPNRMEWHGGMPFGLFKGRRRFQLTRMASGTEFHMREKFSGPLAGLITKSIPDLTPSFEKFGDALKRNAEERA